MKKIRVFIAMVCLFLTVMPVCAQETTQPPKVVDEAEILSAEQETELTARIQELIEKHQMDIVIVTKKKGTEPTVQAEADNFFDNNGYGLGDERDGILLLLDMGYREWAISTSGKTISRFSDYDLSSMGDAVAEDYFAKGQYSLGFRAFLDKLDSKLDYKKEMEEYHKQLEENKLPTYTTPKKDKEQIAKEEEKAKEPAKPTDYIFPAVIGGLIISAFSMWIMKSGMKTTEMQQNASDYQEKEIKVARKDTYVTTTLDKKARNSGNQNDKQPPKRPKPSRNKTTVHRSESGRTHGGASGKF